MKLTFGKDAFGITVSPSMLTIHGRRLPAPQIQYSGNSVTPENAEWNMIQKKFHTYASMPKWFYLLLGEAGLPDLTLGQFKEAVKACGIEYTDPAPQDGFRAVLSRYGDDDADNDAIKEAMTTILKAQIPILLVVLKTKSAAVYARVKYWGDTYSGMFSLALHTLPSKNYVEINIDIKVSTPSVFLIQSFEGIRYPKNPGVQSVILLTLYTNLV